MFTVFVVDDEPAAILYMRKLIRLVKEDFQIIGEYEDGSSCLAEVGEKRPDVIISDIRMPGMSGLDLLKEVNVRFPDTACLLLSGYSEFEYAREAIKARVYEYLLKPILPDEFVAAMNRIRITVSGRYLRERDELLRRMCRTGKVEAENLERYFGTGKYYGILVRKNGLPGENEKEAERTVSSELYEPVKVYGCDEREALFLIPEGCVSPEHLDWTGLRLRKGMGTKEDVFTTVITGKSFTIYEMAEVVQKMYRRLYRELILGKERTFYLEEPSIQRDLSQRDKEAIDRIKELLMKERRGEAYQEFEKLCEEFEREEMPETIVWHTVRYILQTLWVFLEGKIDWEEQGNLLDNILYDSSTIREMCGNLKDLFGIGEPSAASGKIDTQENYLRIRRYIQTHFQEPLSLSRLSREFGISQAYLTKMFRKYEGTSYNSFFTNVRMEEAKKLLLNTDLLIKDIAERIGYSDQFYFSRVFRTWMGCSPSDYVLLKQKYRKEESL